MIHTTFKTTAELQARILAYTQLFSQAPALMTIQAQTAGGRAAGIVTAGGAELPSWSRPRIESIGDRRLRISWHAGARRSAGILDVAAHTAGSVDHFIVTFH